MPQISVKITQISKDFDLKSKDVLDTFKELGIDKKSGGTVDTDEFELFMQHITKSRQIKDLDAYRDGRVKITAPKAEKPAPKAEPALEKKPEPPKPEVKAAEVKKPVEKKAEEKKSEERRSYDNSRQGERKTSYQKYSAAPTENPFAKKIDNMKLVVMGYGDNFPVASNDTEAGMKKNRRVELVIIGKDSNVNTNIYEALQELYNDEEYPKKGDVNEVLLPQLSDNGKKK